MITIGLDEYGHFELKILLLLVELFMMEMITKKRNREY